MNLEIAKRIVAIRKKENLTQTEFAERLNATRPKIAAYELARVNFDKSFLDYICLTFSVNEEWLYSGSGDMFKKPEAFSLNDYADLRGLTPLERNIINGYLSLDKNVREMLVAHFKEIFFTYTLETVSEPTVEKEYRAPWNNNLTKEEAIALVAQRYADAEQGLPSSTTSENSSAGA